MPLTSLLWWSIATFSAHVAAQCNPVTTNGCAAIPGLNTGSYSIDFTQVKSLPSDWILADGSNVTFGSNGLQFNFNHRKEAPYIWTNWYVAYGRIDVEMQVAAGTGLITASVMMSDDEDEIDWELSGSNFGAGASSGKVQTNYFGKGMRGAYDRGTQVGTSPPPQTAFHTYSLNWTPQSIEWLLDGQSVRLENNSGQTTGDYQFPQTPSRLHIGVWDAGDPDTAAGTRDWAGGYTDYSKCPYTAILKSVKITTPNPCKAWKYPDNFSGQWADVKCSNGNLATPSSSTKTTTSAKSKSTDATYTVVAGDNGYTIADKLGCTFDNLKSVNPNVQWDFLNIGQKLNNPGAHTVTPTISTSSSTSTSISASTSRTYTTPLPPLIVLSNTTASTSKTYTAPLPPLIVFSSTTASTSKTYTAPLPPLIVLSSTTASTSKTYTAPLPPLIVLSSTTRASIMSSTTKTYTTPLPPLIVLSSTTRASIMSSTTKTYTTPLPPLIVPSNMTASTKMTYTTPLPPLVVPAKTCTADACVNSMTVPQYRTFAHNFCLNSAQKIKVATPTFLSGCGGDANRIKSACSCLSNNDWHLPTTYTGLNPPTGVAVTTTTTTSSSSTTVTKTTTTQAARQWERWGRKRDEGTSAQKGGF